MNKNMVESMINFEKFLFENGLESTTCDSEFFADRIVMFPKIRPHKLDFVIRLCIDYCQIMGFRQKILEKSIKCPVLIYKLYKRGVFTFNEILPCLSRRDTFIFCFYFRKEIDSCDTFILNKEKPNGVKGEFFEINSDYDQLIEYGFLPSTVEFCLKYDDLLSFKDNNFIDQTVAKWSPFEWSYEPKYFDFLSFSGFFGSIKCFKFLMMNGYEINDRVI